MGRAVGDKIGNLLNRGRKSGEDIGQPPDKRSAIRCLNRWHAGAFEPGVEERIDGIRSHPSIDFRRREVTDRLKAPPTFAFLANRFPRRRAGEVFRCRRCITRVRRTHFDPGAKVSHYFRFEPGFVLRHPQFGLVTNGLKKEARIRVARHHGRTGVPSRPNRLAVIDRETVTMCPGAVVATVAPLHQDWSNAFLKELNPIAVTGLSLQRGEAGADQEGEYQCFHPVRDISGRRWERVAIEGFI